MKAELFTDYLVDPGMLNSASLVAFDEIIREYPFCQPAQLLFLKGLQNDENIRFNRQLKIAAAYATDRKVLYELLTIPRSFTQERDEPLAEKEPRNDIEHQPVVEPKGITEESVKPILASQVEQFIPIADIDLLVFDFPAYPDDGLPEIPELPGKMKSTLSEPVKADSHLLRRTPADELIDRFIENPAPRVLRPDQAPVNNPDVSLNSLKEDDQYLTETLAGIYVKQGYYLKAIQSYEKLSLKIPEKSIYFASQIEMVRDLIKNQ